MNVEPFERETVTRAARSATGQPDAAVTRWVAMPAAHQPDNLTTEALDLVRGTMDTDVPFTMFVKTLRPASASPVWSMIPEQERASVLVELNWLDEPNVYRSALGADLPSDMRLPHLWHLESTELQIRLWLEFVVDEGIWDVERYRRVAIALGGLNGRWPGERVGAELGFNKRGLSYLWHGKTSHFDLPRLAEDSTWKEPAFIVDPELRDDVDHVIKLMPSLIAHLEKLPDALAHGDACPANILIADDRIVAIDWSYASRSSVGSDLGQLFAGRFVDGSADIGRLDTIARTICDGFRDGLAAEGAVVDDDAIEYAFVVHLLARAVFDALATIPEVTAQQAAARVALARFAVDRALTLRLG